MSSGKATISFDSQRIARERARIAQERESARIADEIERARIAEAAEIAAARTRFEIALRECDALAATAHELEVSVPAVAAWNAHTSARADAQAVHAEQAAAHVQRDIERARVTLVRARAEIEGERVRRTKLDALAGDLRVTTDAELVVGASDRPSSARAAAGAARAQNDRYAAALAAEQDALNALLAQAARDRGRIAHEIQDAGLGDGVVEVPEPLAHPELSRSDEARRQLEAIRRVVADDVFDGIRPQWDDADLQREEEPWRTTYRQNLAASIASLGAGSVLPPEVEEAVREVESAATRTLTAAVVTRAVNAIEAVTSRQRRLVHAIDEARRVVDASLDVRSIGVARRCAEALADIESGGATWTDAELGTFLTSRLAGLRAELDAHEADERRQQAAFEQRRKEKAAQQTMDVALRVFEQDPAWQVIETDAPHEHFPASAFAGGFLVRRVDDPTTALMVRRTVDGEIELLHKNIVTPSHRREDAAALSAKCAQLSDVLTRSVAPAINDRLDGGFVVELDVHPDVGTPYRPTANERSTIEASYAAYLAAQTHTHHAPQTRTLGDLG